MAGLFRREQRKSDDTLGYGIYPTLPASYPSERVHEDPTLWIIGKPEQNEKTNALQEADQHTDPVKGKASGSTTDPETDWPRHHHMSCVRYSASTRQSSTTACVLTEYFQFHCPLGRGKLCLLYSIFFVRHRKSISSVIRLGSFALLSGYCHFYFSHSSPVSGLVQR